jgi:hypothetical protein
MASITNYEMDGFPIVEQTLDAYKAVRRVMMEWSDVDTFISELVATDGLYPYNPSSGATVYRVKIEKLPGSTLTASGGTGMVVYDWAALTLWYSTDAPRYWSNLFYTEEVEPYREFHTVNPVAADGTTQILKWTSNSGDNVNEGLGVTLAGHIYVLTFYRASSIPANFFSANGYCNSSAVICYSLGMTYPAQTLLHADPYAKRHAILGGTNKWMLRYRWIYRGANSATWNHKWRPESGGSWDTVWRNGSTQVIFHPTVAFSTLVP